MDRAMLALLVRRAERVSIAILLGSRFRLHRLHLHVIRVLVRDGGLRNLHLTRRETRPTMWTEARNQEVASLTEKQSYEQYSNC